MSHHGKVCALQEHVLFDWDAEAHCYTVGPTSVMGFIILHT